MHVRQLHRTAVEQCARQRKIFTIIEVEAEDSRDLNAHGGHCKKAVAGEDPGGPGRDQVSEQVISSLPLLVVGRSTLGLKYESDFPVPVPSLIPRVEVMRAGYDGLPGCDSWISP